MVDLERKILTAMVMWLYAAGCLTMTTQPSPCILVKSLSLDTIDMLRGH